jgi:hypothetical protein
VAASIAFDMLTSAPSGERLSRSAAIAALRADTTRYRSDVLNALAAATVRAASLRRDRRRRASPGSDAPQVLPTAEGAA